MNTLQNLDIPSHFEGGVLGSKYNSFLKLRSRVRQKIAENTDLHVSQAAEKLFLASDRDFLTHRQLIEIEYFVSTLSSEGLYFVKNPEDQEKGPQRIFDQDRSRKVLKETVEAFSGYRFVTPRRVDTMLENLTSKHFSLVCQPRNQKHFCFTTVGSAARHFTHANISSFAPLKSKGLAKEMDENRGIVDLPTGERTVDGFQGGRIKVRQESEQRLSSCRDSIRGLPQFIRRHF